MRIQSLDLARGFTVLFIAPVHAVLLFASPAIYNTWPVQLLRFIAEGPGAQLFMLLMGISFAQGREKRPKEVLKRVGVLMLAGYLLNFLKFVLPAMLDLLPPGVYTELQVKPGLKGYIQLLFSSDILQFAALGYMTIYLISGLRCYHRWAALLVILICFFSPYCYGLHSGKMVLDYLLQLLGGQPPLVFFPLMPWLVYPLTGLVIGHYIKNGCELVFGYAAAAGLLLLLLSCSRWMPFYHDEKTSFYRTYPSGTFYHLGFLLIWLYIWHLISLHHPHRILTKLLTFLSRRITLIYLVQWPIICWSLPLLHFRRLGFTGSMLAAAGFGAAAIIISCIYLLIKKA